MEQRYAGGVGDSNVKWHLTIGKTHSTMPFMNAKVTLDKAGRVVIPKTLRDELRLAPGDSLTLESDGDHFTLRPVRSSSPLRKKRGIWVFHGDRKISAADTDQALERVREERDRELRGSKA
jgi:AbrB family looped-hinge helix DNA binding protein